MSLNTDGRNGSFILDCSSAFLHAPLPSVEDRPQGPSDINSQSQLVAVAQSSRSVLVPSCMLHGDREPVPSDPVDIEFQNLNSCTELPEEMTSIFKLMTVFVRVTVRVNKTVVVPSKIVNITWYFTGPTLSNLRRRKINTQCRWLKPMLISRSS